MVVKLAEIRYSRPTYLNKLATFYFFKILIICVFKKTLFFHSLSPVCFSLNRRTPILSASILGDGDTWMLNYEF